MKSSSMIRAVGVFSASALLLIGQALAASPGTNRPAEFSGTATATATANSRDGALDPRLIGAWVNEKMIASGGSSFASFTTVRTLSFDPSGRVLQQVSSVGGGENWHYGGGKKTEFAGRWLARDGVVHVQAEGGGEYVPAGRYRFADAYLITENALGRLVWQRR